MAIFYGAVSSLKMLISSSRCCRVRIVQMQIHQKRLLCSSGDENNKKMPLHSKNTDHVINDNVARSTADLDKQDTGQSKPKSTVTGDEAVSRPGWAKALDIIKEYEDKIARDELEQGVSEEQLRQNNESRTSRPGTHLKSSYDTDFGHDSTQLDVETINKEREAQSFATLLKNSKFIEMGSVPGSVVIGTIILKEGKDLYIDFGGKFHCVCPDPDFDRNL